MLPKLRCLRARDSLLFAKIKFRAVKFIQRLHVKEEAAGKNHFKVKHKKGRTFKNHDGISFKIFMVKIT